MNERPSRSKRRRGIVAVVAINVIVVAVIVELGTRFLYPIIRPNAFTWSELRENLQDPDRDEAIITMDAVRAPADAPLPVIHPFLGYVIRPGSTLVTRKGESLPYSAFGFYGEEPIIGRSEDDIVVAISGGSVAASLWHHESEYIRTRLAASPEFAGKRIHVQSFALGGYKQPQMLQALAYVLALGAQVDIWIELDGFNDVVLPVTENLATGDPLDYPREWRMLADPAPSPEIAQWRTRIDEEKMTRERNRTWFASVPLGHSAFWLACWDTLDRASLDRIDQSIKSLSETAKAIRQNITREEKDAAIVRSIEIWKNASIQMRRLCEANGISFFHFLQPNQYVAGSKPFNDEERRVALAVGGYQPAATDAYPHLIDAAAELTASGFPVHDLTMIYKDEPRTVYKDSCCHVNDLGNDIMGEVVVNVVLGE